MVKYRRLTTFKYIIYLYDNLTISYPNLLIRQMEEIHPLLKVKRYKVLVEYPETRILKNAKVGGILEDDFATALTRIVSYAFYPGIFKELAWYEELSTSQLIEVKFVQIVKYVGYDVIGDCLAVDRYDIANLDTPNPIVIGYYAGGRRYALTDVEPALKAKKV